MLTLPDPRNRECRYDSGGAYSGRYGHGGAIRTALGSSLAAYATPTRQKFSLPDTFDSDGTWHRAVQSHDAILLFSLRPDGLLRWHSLGRPAPQAEIESLFNRLVRPLPISMSAMQHLPVALRERFQARMPAIHLPSASLDEAVIKAIVRQVIRAEHALHLIDQVAALAGKGISHDGCFYTVFPTAEDIIKCDTSSLDRIGLGFKASRLRSVANALLCTDLLDCYMHIAPDELVAKLQAIPGIGAWTARTAVSDVLTSWHTYPIDDLAVRTWAKRLWPGEEWPDAPPLFAERWRQLNGCHVGIVTFYLLATAKMDGDMR